MTFVNYVKTLVFFKPNLVISALKTIHSIIFKDLKLIVHLQIIASLIEEIITAIKDDDIYRNLSAYPLSDQRSTALA